ncbi:hypothetical protein [Flavobacterium sharifuzzamanii]|uniref:hypothetical protein n=1 Tax=Flavobacterium sharifuzzamanii TaxID=2211133 RepID=UPI000DAB9FF4|nr:hypothetical protein [Flavobacterium sharifuzzamanii]KAF2080540.1 hypothetical protein DMA14_14685 [Flavobacterium sharifuzzamanii]
MKREIEKASFHTKLYAKISIASSFSWMKHKKHEKGFSQTYNFWLKPFLIQILIPLAKARGYATVSIKPDRF